MTPRKRPIHLAASVRARLVNLSRRRGVELQLLLSEFAIERLLYRLGVSSHADRFVLKGATLFKLWSDHLRRATWDLDLLGRGTSAVNEVEAIIRDLTRISDDDGLVFNADSITAEEIRTRGEYTGVRARLRASLAEARIPVQVDVGFGDAVVPPPTRATYPVLLDHAAPRILAYPREAVVAEKLEAMVTLGVTNSRMKDFYDIHRLASDFEFDGRLLSEAILATFARRGTPFPRGEPLVLEAGFLAAPARRTQWRAFLRRGRLEASLDTNRVAEQLRSFISPVMEVIGQGQPFEQHWDPGGPWRRTVE